MIMVLVNFKELPNHSGILRTTEPFWNSQSSIILKKNKNGEYQILYGWKENLGK